MSKFKVGDKVRRVKLSQHIIIFAGMGVGEVDVVTRVLIETMDLEKYGVGHNMDYFELVEDTSKHHEHHDLIIQWAKGAKIEYYSTTFDEWLADDCPSWKTSASYRIKPPVPKTDKERIVELEARVEELENSNGR